MKKSKLVAVAVAAVVGAFGLGLLPATNTYADDIKTVCTQSGVPDDVKRANGCSGYTDGPEISDVIIGGINGVVGVLALVAVIFVLVGAVNYMTSTGDAAKLQKAKNTILYALIGLVIAVLAFAIVNFVIVNIIGQPETTEITETENPNGGGGD